jgi:hypothetical protein
MTRAYHNNRKVSRLQAAWNGKLVAALDAKPLVVWGPHCTNHLKAVCLREHDTPSGWRVLKGSVIQFTSPEFRDRWLAAHHPRKWGKLLRKWVRV